MSENNIHGRNPSGKPSPIIASYLPPVGEMIELQLDVDHDAELGLIIIELVRSDAALPAARLVLGADPALDLALRLTAAVMKLRGLG